MPRTPTRIYGPAAVAAGPVTVYTVPASQKVVVRRIHVMNNSGTAATFTLSVGADAAGTRVIGPYSVAAFAIFLEYGPMTLETTEIITVSSGTASALILTIDADVYTLG